MREARIMSKLSHKHVLRYLDNIQVMVNKNLQLVQTCNVVLY